MKNERHPAFRIVECGIGFYLEYGYLYFAVAQGMSPIHNSRLAFELLQTSFNPDAEEFWLITLNTDLSTKGLSLIAKGTLNYCPVHPRDLFREAIRANAYAMIIAHNHPSRNPAPTKEDIVLTKKLCKIARLLEIPILDHLVFTDKAYYSFKEHHLI
ncbi:MAG: JAB domain-containing protein [Bdellovibrionaceae bacterium]|nr:JAB domain-containing protein [Pseudobdellovibrionaceae bacterium]